MPRASFKIFLAIAIGCIILLSLAWIWVGVGYNALLLKALSPFMAAGVTLEQHGHDIQVIVPLAQSETQTAMTVIHSMAMNYGLIVAASVLLAVPGVTLRARLVLVLVTLVIAFVAHGAGLYLLINRLEGIAPGPAPTQGTILRALTFAWLFIPSLVWLPVLLKQWNPLPVRTT